MKILHVTQPTEAGVAVVVAALARHQAEAGHEVVIACPSDEIGDGPLGDLLSTEGISIVDWAARRQPGPSVPGEVRRLGKIVRAETPDVVILHSAKAGLAGRLAVRGRHTTIFVPHAWSFEAADGLIGAASTRWEVIAQRWTDVTVCVSSEEQRRGVEVGIDADKTVVVRNGVDLNRFSPLPQAVARQQLGLDDVPTVVCVGRLARQKGQDRLLAAWPAVRYAVPDATLVLVGDGPDLEHLRERGVAGVRIVGGTDDPQSWYSAGDVVAFTSRWEGCALVPMEAMACARSVVAVGVTGVTATLEGTGTVVANGDDPAARRELASALIHRLRDATGTRADGARARAAVSSHSSLDHTLRTWDLLISSIQDHTYEPVMAELLPN